MRTHSSHTGLSSSHSAAGDTFQGMRRIRVALYVRVSTEEQVDGHSLQAQRREIERYASQHSLTLGWSSSVGVAE